MFLSYEQAKTRLFKREANLLLANASALVDAEITPTVEPAVVQAQWWTKPGVHPLAWW